MALTRLNFEVRQSKLVHSGAGVTSELLLPQPERVISEKTVKKKIKTVLIFGMIIASSIIIPVLSTNETEWRF